MKSDVWSFGTTLNEMMGITPYVKYEKDDLPTMNGDWRLPFKADTIKSSELVDFLEKCFRNANERRSVNELLDVSVMG